jgi:hypothetical protein
MKSKVLRRGHWKAWATDGKGNELRIEHMAGDRPFLLRLIDFVPLS